MLSTIENLEFNMEEEMVSELSEDSFVDEMYGEAKVHIPMIMTNIPNGKPMQTNLSTNGLGVFINDKRCMPAITTMLLKESNYLSAKYNNNSFMQDIKQYDPKKGRYIPEKQQIRVNFLNGRLNNLHFNTNSEQRN